MESKDKKTKKRDTYIVIEVKLLVQNTVDKFFGPNNIHGELFDDLLVLVAEFKQFELIIVSQVALKYLSVREFNGFQSRGGKVLDF